MIVRNVYDSELKGTRNRTRMRKYWEDGVKEMLARKGSVLKEVSVCI